eukprot:c36352_g1_i1 orf=1-849(-)
MAGLRMCFLFATMAFFALILDLVMGSTFSRNGDAESLLSSPGQKQPMAVLALKNAQKFQLAAGILASLDMNLLPASATLLVPNDKAVSKVDNDINGFGNAFPTLRYHVVTRQLSFRDLLDLRVGTRLETLLKDNTVLITNSDQRNYTVDDVRLTRPDIYFDDTMVIHGIDGILNASVYGNRSFSLVRPPAPAVRTLPPPFPASSPKATFAAAPRSINPAFEPSESPPSSSVPRGSVSAHNPSPPIASRNATLPLPPFTGNLLPPTSSIPNTASARHTVTGVTT